MKRLKVCGFVIGLFVGVFASGFFWMVSMLPGAPSQYGPLFPISDAPIPADAVGKYRTGTVGFDVYTNFKKPPVIRKDDAVPIKRGFASNSVVGGGGWTFFKHTNGFGLNMAEVCINWANLANIIHSALLIIFTIRDSMSCPSTSSVNSGGG